MYLNFSSCKKLLKGLFIEGLSLGMAFLADRLFKNYEEDHENVRFAIDVRVYYLSKNILYLLDTCFITKENNLRHLYSGTFNLGVVATIYPASQQLPVIASQSIVYVTGSTARLLAETSLTKQSIKQHLKLHSGKLIGGAAGIFLSLIPAVGMSAPAFYWSGELYDVWQIRGEDETLISILSTPKSTVPVQACLAAMVKMSARLSSASLPLPEFAVDAVIGSSHLTIINALACTNSATHLSTRENHPLDTGIELASNPKGSTQNVLPDNHHDHRPNASVTVEVEQKATALPLP